MLHVTGYNITIKYICKQRAPSPENDNAIYPCVQFHEMYINMQNKINIVMRKD